jgi:hypothetical protein
MKPTTNDCELAQSPEVFDAIYRLRYECYRRDESIAARPDRRFSDSFDTSVNHFSFLVRSHDGDPAATVRLSVVRPDLGWTDSPGARVFGDHLCFQAIARQSFVEASRLCFGRQAGREGFVRLVAHMAALADFYDIAWLVACPRVEHARAYERLFGFRALAAPRRYFGVAFETTLLGVRIDAIRAYVASDRRMTSAWSDALERLSAALPAPASSQPDGIAISVSSGK